jgi:SET and MYND domain-containing protein 5
VLFEEDPIVCSQFPWNATCKYRACDYCMRYLLIETENLLEQDLMHAFFRALETAEENIRRLLNNPTLVIPHPECCSADQSKHAQCDDCGVRTMQQL